MCGLGKNTVSWIRCALRLVFDCPLLVALIMEGKFAGEGLQSIDEDDDILSAMARELVERNGIGETADSVWRALTAEHQKLFPTNSQSRDDAIRRNAGHPAGYSA